MRIRRTAATFPLLLTAAAAALALSACGGDYGSMSSSSPATAGKGSMSAASGAPGSPTAVKVKDFAYAPPTLTVAAGSKVAFTNDDSTNHTATATSGGGFDTGTIAPGATKTVTLGSPGTFAYVCSFHPFMHGTVRVTG